MHLLLWSHICYEKSFYYQQCLHDYHPFCHSCFEKCHQLFQYLCHPYFDHLQDLRQSHPCEATSSGESISSCKATSSCKYIKWGSLIITFFAGKLILWGSEEASYCEWQPPSYYEALTLALSCFAWRYSYSKWFLTLAYGSKQECLGCLWLFLCLFGVRKCNKLVLIYLVVVRKLREAFQLKKQRNLGIWHLGGPNDPFSSYEDPNT